MWYNLLKIHVSVLAKESVEFLTNLEKGGTCVDCTLGGGGHALEVLKRYPKAKVIGIDRDEEALRIASQRLLSFGERIKLVRANFKELNEILDSLGVRAVEAIIADVGLSSFQIDDGKRGFSFEKNGPLDMRMGLNEKSAYDVVNTYSVEELANVIFSYSEERFSRRIARVIVERRPIATTFELRDAIVSATPVKYRKSWRKNVARVFQAIRIEVNGELENLRALLKSSKQRLNKGGRVAVVSFHSLEDRIVKKEFLTEGFKPLTKKPVMASEMEKRENPRSRSAKLRVAERI